MGASGRWKLAKRRIRDTMLPELNLNHASEDDVTHPPQPARRKPGFAPVLAGVVVLMFASLSTTLAQTARTRHASTIAARPALTAPVRAFGTPNAPIKLEVFSDYQCPVCRNFYEGTLRSLMATYIPQGKVYLVHHDFPLPMHQYSYQAARWANAAAEIGKFEDVEAALYDNQAAWSTDGNIEKFVQGAMSPADFKKVQKLMAGCEPNSHTCAIDEIINADIALGRQIPVQGTPTYVITSKGQKYPAGSGNVSWDIMRQFFDSLLSQ